MDWPKQKGHKFLFIPSQKRLALVNEISTSLLSQIKRASDPKEQAKILGQGHQLTIDLAMEIGISPEIIELANLQIEQLLQFTQDIDQLQILVDRVLSNEMSIKFQIVLLTNFIAQHILNAQGLSNEVNRKKITFTCFFHDIYLTSDDQLFFRSDVDLAITNLSQKRKNTIKNHASMAAQIIERFPNIPSDVPTLIREHHGKEKGRGLGKPDTKLHNLTYVFIMAEEWAMAIIRKRTKAQQIDKAGLVKYLSGKYGHTEFLKILPILADLEL